MLINIRAYAFLLNYTDEKTSGLARTESLFQIFREKNKEEKWKAVTMPNVKFRQTWFIECSILYICLLRH